MKRMGKHDVLRCISPMFCEIHYYSSPVQTVPSARLAGRRRRRGHSCWPLAGGDARVPRLSCLFVAGGDGGLVEGWQAPWSLQAFGVRQVCYDVSWTVFSPLRTTPYRCFSIFRYCIRHLHSDRGDPCIPEISTFKKHLKLSAVSVIVFKLSIVDGWQVIMCWLTSLGATWFPNPWLKSFCCIFWSRHVVTIQVD